MGDHNRNSDTTWINIRIPAEVRAQIERLAELHDRPLGRECSVALRQYVEREEAVLDAA
jgi:predicted transcriptional regulator